MLSFIESDLGKLFGFIAIVITIGTPIIHIACRVKIRLKKSREDVRQTELHYEDVKDEIHNILSSSKTQGKRTDAHIFLASLQRQVSDSERRVMDDSRRSSMSMNTTAIILFIFGSLSISLYHSESLMNSALEGAVSLEFGFFMIGVAVIFYFSDMKVTEKFYKTARRYQRLSKSIHTGIEQAMSEHVPTEGKVFPESYLPKIRKESIAE